MRNILITGGSGGLAQEIVKYLPDDKLLILGRDKAKLDAIYKKYPHAKCYQIDITDEVAVKTLLDELYQTYGQIDILINNAGYAVYDDFDKFNTKDVRAMFEVNTFASMTFCQLVGKKMKLAKKGHIINIVSMSGLMASAKSSLYSASKFAMIGYSNVLRLELAAFNVYVTTVNPGPIATSFFNQADPDGSYLKSVEQFLLQPDAVAQKITAILGKNKREINLPWQLRLAYRFYTLFPKFSDFLARTVFNLK